MPVDVTVINPDSSTATLENGFSFSGAPTVAPTWHTADQAYSTGSSSTTINATAPDNLSDGDLVVLVVFNANSVLDEAVSSITPPAGFVPLVFVHEDQSIAAPETAVFAKVADSEPSSYSFSKAGGQTSNRYAVLAGRVTGFDASLIEDSSKTLGTGTSAALGSLTVGGEALMLSAVCSNSNISAINQPAGMTLAHSDVSVSAPRNAVALEDVSEGATGSRTWNWTTGRQYAAVLFAIPGSST